MWPYATAKADPTGPDGWQAALLLRAAETSKFGLTLADARQPDLPLVYANEAFKTMTGYQAADVLGNNCRMLQGPETDPESVAKIRRTLQLETASTVLILNYRKDGSRFWNRFQLSPVHDQTGRLAAYLGMQVDITADVDRIGLESERQKLETLGRLAGGVAHELNNALQPILLYAEMLEQPDALDPQAQADCAKGIVENARFASSVVSQILAFARRDGLEDGDHEALEIITQAVDFAADYLPAGISLELQGFDAAKALAERRITVNRTALYQVITNLFKNATAAMNDRGRLRVGLSLLQAGLDPVAGESERRPAIEISVADEGCGIDPKTLKHVFEPFFTTKAPGQGTGLGLSTIYGIVERWGGRVAAESVLGEGSVFRVLIPVSSAQ